MRIDTAAEIDRLSALRQEIWCNGGGIPGEIEKISKKLVALYEEERMARASDESGGRSRKDIQRSARLETEIERLMSG